MIQQDQKSIMDTTRNTLVEFTRNNGRSETVGAEVSAVLL